MTKERARGPARSHRCQASPCVRSWPFFVEPSNNGATTDETIKEPPSELKESSGHHAVAMSPSVVWSPMGGMNTHSAVARTFCALCCTAHSALLTRVHVHAWFKTQGCQKGLLHAHVAHLHLAFSVLMFHPHPCCSRTLTSTPRSRPHSCRALPDPKARVKRTSAPVPLNLALWSSPHDTDI